MPTPVVSPLRSTARTCAASLTLAIVTACGHRAGFSSDASTPSDVPALDATETSLTPVPIRNDAGEGGAGDPDGGDYAPGDCIGDLSPVGLGDFTLVFRITTTARALSQVISQRAFCDGRHMWNVRMQSTGAITFEIGDQANGYLNATTTARVNDGVPHRVAIFRADGRVFITVDSVRTPLRYVRTDTYPMNGPERDSTPPAHDIDGAVRLGPALPALEWTGGMVCTADGTRPLVGEVVPLCVTPGQVGPP